MSMAALCGLVAGCAAFVVYPWLPQWLTASVIIALGPLTIINVLKSMKAKPHD